MLGQGDVRAFGNTYAWLRLAAAVMAYRYSTCAYFTFTTFLLAANQFEM